MILTGNTIVVTGGGSRIGRGLAEALEHRGAAVIVAGQSSHAVQDAAATPGMAHMVLDQDDATSIARFAEALMRDHPATNVLINDAGIQRVEDLTKGDTASAEGTIATNLLVHIRVTAALLPLLTGEPRRRPSTSPPRSASCRWRRCRPIRRARRRCTRTPSRSATSFATRPCKSSRSYFR